MADTRRLFFALWPPAPVQARLAALAREAGIQGRPVAQARLHLTLLFLGDVPEAAVAPLCAAAGEVTATPFELTLTRLGHFYRAGVAWIGPEVTPEPLALLADELRAAADAAEVAPKSRRFRPHVTLARRAPRPASWRPAQPVTWPVHGFSLTQSTQAEGRAIYRDVARWPLADHVDGVAGME